MGHWPLCVQSNNCQNTSNILGKQRPRKVSERVDVRFKSDLTSNPLLILSTVPSLCYLSYSLSTFLLLQPTFTLYFKFYLHNTTYTYSDSSHLPFPGIILVQAAANSHLNYSTADLNWSPSFHSCSVSLLSSPVSILSGQSECLKTKLRLHISCVTFMLPQQNWFSQVYQIHFHLRDCAYTLSSFPIYLFR